MQKRVRVRLSDLNGPKGGVDTECLLALELNDGRRVLTTARTAARRFRSRKRGVHPTAMAGSIPPCL
jgi:hypothetical protein